MCHVQLYKSQTCRHTWVRLTHPCADGMNIENCPSFQDGRSRHSRGLRKAVAHPHSCPRCDLKDEYDGTLIRMIAESRRGTKVGGNGPGKSRSGVELAGVDFKCIVM